MFRLSITDAFAEAQTPRRVQWQSRCRAGSDDYKTLVSSDERRSSCSSSRKRYSHSHRRSPNSRSHCCWTAKGHGYWGYLPFGCKVTHFFSNNFNICLFSLKNRLATRGLSEVWAGEAPPSPPKPTSIRHLRAFALTITNVPRKARRAP